MKLSIRRKLLLGFGLIFLLSHVNGFVGFFTNTHVFFEVAFVGSFILTLLVSLYLSEKLSDPIRRLKEGADKLKDGEFGTRIEISSGDETEDLANAINTMADKLKATFDQLEDKVKELEIQKVRLDKTAQLLIKRDKEIREINIELEWEKEVITAEVNKLAIIIAGVSEAVIAVDLERNIVLFNKKAEQMTGLQASSVIGKPINLILKVYEKNEELAIYEYCPIGREAHEGVVVTKENLKIVGLNEKETHVNLIAGQIKEGKSVNLGCILTLHDVSKERELERMKIDFVSIAAHELRTPLTSIKGYLSVFMKENAGKLNKVQQGFLTRINIASKQLGALIENLLNVSNIERGELRLSRGSFDMIPLVKSSIGEFLDRASDKELILEFVESTKKVPIIEADELRVGEVVNNLIDNAIANTPSGGEIRVKVEKEGDMVVTSMKDNGVGIPQSAMENLFTKFFRVSGKLERGSKGTGLGLYISKAIVEKHNGKIWVESEEGRGSEFSFSLPIKWHAVENEKEKKA